LSEKYTVYLGAFIDDTNDWQYVGTLKTICEETCLLGLNTRVKKIKSLTALFSGDALSLPYYYDRRMSNWVNSTIRKHNINRIFIFSSQMAQYVMGDRYEGIRRVIDYVDVDSDKWLQYGKSNSGLLAWLYTREGKRLFDFEREIIKDFDAGVFVSSNEASLFEGMITDNQRKLTYISNGVNCEYFNPTEDYNNPYGENDKVLVFTGAMDYWANIDAVCWFAKKIFIELSKLSPKVKFYIVGSNPDKVVLDLESISNIHVTGSVEDIRPYIRYATAVVAPLRIARGLQNKVLEAMSMAKPILATPAAMEGIMMEDRLVNICTTEGEFIEQTLNAINTNDSNSLNLDLRSFVENNYTWESNLVRLDGLLG
jgi:sugar transferase (PEP-CTERM/EpsH1 system associated)